MFLLTQCLGKARWLLQEGPDGGSVLLSLASCAVRIQELGEVRGQPGAAEGSGEPNTGAEQPRAPLLLSPAEPSAAEKWGEALLPGG